MDSLDVPPSNPPPPPPKRLSRPKITLQIPTTPVPMPPKTPGTASTYRIPQKLQGKIPATPGSHISDPHGNPYFSPFTHMYNNKASEFMFKQFAGFRDFTMNTAKSGLSAGEKTAFWFVNKLRTLSKRWFTHFFLTLCLVLYSVMGASMFMAIEGPSEESNVKNLTEARSEVAAKIEDVLTKQLQNESVKSYIEKLIIDYESEYTELVKNINSNGTKKKTWTFWNSMFYAGTIYTTIGNFVIIIG